MAITSKKIDVNYLKLKKYKSENGKKKKENQKIFT